MELASQVIEQAARKPGRAGWLARQTDCEMTVWDNTIWFRAFARANPSAAAGMLAATFMVRADHSGVFWPSRTRMAWESNLTDRHLRRILPRYFLEPGWIIELDAESRAAHLKTRPDVKKIRIDRETRMYRLQVPTAAAFDLAFASPFDAQAEES